MSTSEVRRCVIFCGLCVNIYLSFERVEWNLDPQSAARQTHLCSSQPNWPVMIIIIVRLIPSKMAIKTV